MFIVCCNFNEKAASCIKFHLMLISTFYFQPMRDKDILIIAYGKYKFFFKNMISECIVFWSQNEIYFRLFPSFVYIFIMKHKNSSFRKFLERHFCSQKILFHTSAKKGKKKKNPDTF